MKDLVFATYSKRFRFIFSVCFPRIFFSHEIYQDENLMSIDVVVVNDGVPPFRHYSKVIAIPDRVGMIKIHYIF